MFKPEITSHEAEQDAQAAQERAGRDDTDRCAVCHRDAHRPGMPTANHGHAYVAPVGHAARADLDLADTSRVVEIVSADGIAWETTGRAGDVARWLGNAREVDREAIRLCVRQVAAEGRALRISFSSMMTFLLGYDFASKRYQISVPE